MLREVETTAVTLFTENNFTVSLNFFSRMSSKMSLMNINQILSVMDKKRKPYLYEIC